MALVNLDIYQQISVYATNTELSPLLFPGNSLDVLREFPPESIDFCMTSPPYWSKREYQNGGIGLEENHSEYITHLLAVFAEIKRVLKPTGSFWLNLGDTYLEKQLLGIPWRIALRLSDEQGWILRNSIVWNKVKGGFDTSKDRLRNTHENIFHFVKNPQGYYYNLEAVRSAPRKAQVINGAVISATGVSGVRYKRQIEMSTALSVDEKRKAFLELDKMLASIQKGEISDFRMMIRGQQRSTHSDSEKVSGRARELREKGFYFLRYHPDGSKPGDVWDILPEDDQKRADHVAPYPTDLCKIPILSTCPPDGVILDPFCGTGTTLYVARTLGRKSIGIDISETYLRQAHERCNLLI